MSLLTLMLAVVLPIVSSLEGKKPEHSWILFMFVGFIGISAYQAILSLRSRILDLEARAGQAESGVSTTDTHTP